MYFAAVLLFMLVLPVGSIAAELLGGDHTSTMDLVGKWFVFWAVGVRLLTAGIRQIVKPGLTASGIFGIEDKSSWILVQELGFATSAIGIAGVVTITDADWRPPTALVAALFYGPAALRHVVQRHRSREENIAMVSDLFIAVLLVAYLVAQI